MNLSGAEINRDPRGSLHVKQEGLNYGYDNSYINCSNNTANATSLNQPLPGQPPLPPMPPPQGAVPPPPSVFPALPTQMAQIHTWPQWQWITPQQANVMTQQQSRDISTGAPLRSNFVRRDRYNNHNRNVYQQRGGFNRKNRKQRFEHIPNQASFYNAALPNGLGLEWQLSMQNQLPHMAAAAISNKDKDKNKDVKEGLIIRKNKQRKPMSQSYASRPWNQVDAERALEVENKFTKAARARSLIIKFPDPDINKDIVRQFHPGIRNIHFQSPSGPRYCFVQMAENVDIDEAIKNLEGIKFGLGYLKAERKSMRDEENPKPEEIDPYTLYIGNLPECVNINEVKKKFPPAARIDVGFAQKMRNTRYAFIRYNSVEDSIKAYEQAHNLMWDTRSIIVRFRRQRGNNCLPGEPNQKKAKKEAAASATNNGIECEKPSGENKEAAVSSSNGMSQHNTISISSSTESNGSADVAESEAVTGSVSYPESVQQQQKQSQSSSDSEITYDRRLELGGNSQEDDSLMLAEVKEEPIDYDEMTDEQPNDYEVDDTDDEGEYIRKDEDDDESDYYEESTTYKSFISNDSKRVVMENENVNRSAMKDDIPPDDLDDLFKDIESKTNALNGD